MNHTKLENLRRLGDFLTKYNWNVRWKPVVNGIGIVDTQIREAVNQVCNILNDKVRFNDRVKSVSLPEYKIQVSKKVMPMGGQIIRPCITPNQEESIKIDCYDNRNAHLVRIFEWLIGLYKGVESNASYNFNDIAFGLEIELLNRKNKKVLSYFVEGGWLESVSYSPLDESSGLFVLNLTIGMCRFIRPHMRG